MKRIGSLIPTRGCHSVGGSQRTRQRAGHAEALDRASFFESLAQRGGGTGMVALERAGETLELALGELGRFRVPRVAQRPGDARVHRLGQMSQDVAQLVDLAALRRVLELDQPPTYQRPAPLEPSCRRQRQVDAGKLTMEERGRIGEVLE